MSNDLMQKLAISKKIMDKHNQVPRGHSSESLPTTENFNTKYNIQEDTLERPKIQETISARPVTQEAVLNSKLPDEIKRLMIENPIVQPQLNGPSLSNEIIEGAARLMNNGQQKQTTIKESNNTSNNDLKQMIRDVVRDTVRDVVREELQSAGLLSENSQNTNEQLSLRVGKHIFEGKVLKIKKVKQ